MRSSRTLRLAAGRTLAAGLQSPGPLLYLPQDVQTRGFCLMPLIRGLHSGLTSVLDLERAVREGPSSRASSKPPSGPRAAHPTGYRSQGFRSSASQQSVSRQQAGRPTSRPNPNDPLPEQVRSLMRSVASPVVVCTSTDKGEHRAMTMSSFTSLTLTPTPLITFNVKTPSRTLEAISSSRQFNIHILSGDESGVRVADHFTRGNVEGKGLWGLKFEAVEGESMPPTLQEEGVMYVLRCKLFDETLGGGMVSVRDHVMVVGEVLEVASGKGEHNGTEFGLAYADRKYRGVGGVLPTGHDSNV